MIKQTIKFFVLVMSFLSLAMAAACSYQPEDPGQCKLVCGSAIIGGNNPEFSIALKTGVVKTECGATAAGSAVGPYRTEFLIGESIKDQNNAAAGVRPVPNISIEPIIVGNRPTVNNENDTDSRYKGLLTLRDNWCLDACGVVTLDTVGQCPGVGASDQLSIQLHSGALFSEPALFNIETKEPPSLTP